MLSAPRMLSRRHSGVLIWAAYFLVPVSVGGWIHGVPLGPLDACGLGAVAWLAAYRGRIGGSVVVGTMLAVSVAWAVAIPGSGGFRARYFPNAAAEGDFEPGVEFPRGAYTRIDQRLEFSPGSREFPLAFFNDVARFNFYKRDEPARDKLAFAVEWNGYLLVEDNARARTLYLFTPQASGQLLIDLKPELTVSDGLHTTAIELTPGWHRLDVHFSSPYGAPRAFAAGSIDGNRRVPFGASTIVTRPIAEWQMRWGGWLGRAKTGADALALSWLALLIALSVRDRIPAIRLGGSLMAARQFIVPVLLIAAFAEAVVFALPWAYRLRLLPGGDDSMTYEFYARDILLHGPLMTLGLPVGQGEPFYYQAFYPYFVAGVHTLFGESLFGVILVQRLLLVCTIWILLNIAIRLGGERVWPIALAVSSFFVYWKVSPIANDVLNEALFVPLLVAWVAALMRACVVPGIATSVWAGLLGGLAAITRSTAVLAWVAVLPVSWAAWKPVARRNVLLATMLVCSVSVFSSIAIRNWIVARTFSPSPSELGVTLLGGNQPPEGLTLDLHRRAQVYDRFGINDYTREVVEYALTAPATFAWNLGRKALFALGIYEPYAPGWGYSPVYIVVWVMAVLGLTTALRAGALPMTLVMLPALVALSQFAAVVAVYPKGERLILPFYTVIVPYACLGIDRVLRGRDRRWS